MWCIKSVFCNNRWKMNWIRITKIRIGSMETDPYWNHTGSEHYLLIVCYNIHGCTPKCLLFILKPSRNNNSSVIFVADYWPMKIIPPMCPVMRIQTLLIRIRILLFKLTQIWIRLFDTDPNPYHFKEVMYLKKVKWYFLYNFTWFSLSVGPTGPN